jgi:hypothetical protein
LPQRPMESDLPTLKRLNLFHGFTCIGLRDMRLGRVARRGPSASAMATRVTVDSRPLSRWPTR